MGKKKKNKQMQKKNKTKTKKTLKINTKYFGYIMVIILKNKG